jgi:hypothetical protein
MIHLLVTAFGAALPVEFAWRFGSSVFVGCIMWCMSLMCWESWSGLEVVGGVEDA